MSCVRLAIMIARCYDSTNLFDLYRPYSVSHGASAFHGAFVWARRALSGLKRRSPARAVGVQPPLRPHPRRQGLGAQEGPPGIITRTVSSTNRTVTVKASDCCGLEIRSALEGLRRFASSGLGRARSHGRFAPPFLPFMPHLRTYPVPLFLRRECGRTPGRRGDSFLCLRASMFLFEWRVV